MLTLIRNKISDFFYSVKKLAYGEYPKVRWTSWNTFNLDVSLAGIIRDALVAYKKDNYTILTEDEEGNDTTDATLDEMIWAFTYILTGGADEDESLNELRRKAYGAAETVVTPLEDAPGFSELTLTGVDREAADEYARREKEMDDRVQDALYLFAKHYRRLWI